MTMKAYRKTRHGSDYMQRLPARRPQARRSGSFWGVSWQIEDGFDSGDWDAMPGDRTAGSR